MLNSLIITPAPKETITQFTNDLFYKFRDFNNINIVEIKKSSDIQPSLLQKDNIIIISKQLIDDYVLDKTIVKFKELKLNFIVFDENHFHGTTKKSKNIFDSYCYYEKKQEKTIKLYLTATFIKPLTEWCISEDNQFHWDIEDERFCKARDIDSLIDKHGDDVRLFLNEDNKEHMLNVYDNMPDLHIFTNMMERERYQIIKERINDTSYGFSSSTLLSGEFPDEVDLFLRYITGSNKEQDYPKKDLSIFGRIKRIAIETNSRTKLK
jgi:hypothetical protein